jgi:hypothetical protein
MVGKGAMMRGIGWAEVGIFRVVTKLIVLQEMPQHVDPEAIDAAGKPETHDVMHGAPDVRIAPIEVRLSGKKRVVIVLIGRRVELPRAPAKIGTPVVRGTAVRSWIPPDVPIALWIMA